MLLKIFMRNCLKKFFVPHTNWELDNKIEGLNYLMYHKRDGALGKVNLRLKSL